jgi:hypothetical protein
MQLDESDPRHHAQKLKQMLNETAESMLTLTSLESLTRRRRRSSRQQQMY